MGTVTPIVTEHAIAEWLRKYPARFYACRVAHNFPKLIPGNKKRTRTSIDRDPDTGVRTIRQFCTCGRERYRPLNADNTLGGKSWKYRDPEGYSQPPGYGLKRSDFSDMYWSMIVTEYEESDDSVAEVSGQTGDSSS